MISFVLALVREGGGGSKSCFHKCRSEVSTFLKLIDDYLQCFDP
jgi:hypothetical protein